MLIGAKLGAYEVIAKLGEGGMGEVYRARDTRLKRDVAIKVLSETFSNEVDRLARFQREAELLASLNHPNIAAVYGLEPLADGASAIVLELVEGPTLADRIAQGPIPVDEALPIARQIAEALEAAHDRGVIHRDLKPANIKVTSDGSVKVLDFGLAKMLETEAASAAVSHSPTLSVHATYAGVILGTAAYMSPEQARGKPVDRRTDIWAFGCVLFEMLAGRQTFDAGETVSDAVAAILKNEPDWSALPSDTPAHIQTLVRRCLQKDPKRRLPHIGVARLEIEEGKIETVSSVAQLPPRSRWRRALPIAAAIVITAAIAGLGFWIFRPSLPKPMVAMFSVTLPDGQSFTGASRKVVAISPDGSKVVYLANDRLYLRSIGELDAHVVPGSDVGLRIQNPTFSPDGQSIAFFAQANGTLRRISVNGGTAVTIGSAGSPFGMSWGDDGIVVGQADKGIVRFDAIGGSAEQIVSVEGDQIAHEPQMLPGGDAVLFTLAKGTDVDRWDKAQIVVQSLTSRSRRTVIEGGADAHYIPSDHLVYAVGGTLFGVAFDPESQSVRGAAAPIVPGIRRGTSSSAQPGVAQFAASQTGSLVYLPGPSDTGSGLRIVVLADRNGAAVPLKIPPGPYAHPRVSPDGTRLVLNRDDARESDIWVYELAGATAMRRLTFGGRNRFPIWSADGRRVTFQSDREGDRGIWWQPADGGGAERLTQTEEGETHVPESWSPDGKRFLFSSIKSSGVSLWVFALDDRKTTTLGDVRSAQLAGAAFSPDGRWVAYTFVDRIGDLTSPNRGVYVQPFPATGATFQVPKTSIDYHPAWSRDGKELFYVPSANRSTVAVTVQTVPSLAFSRPVELPKLPRPELLGTDVRGYDVLPDGRFITVVPASEQTASGTPVAGEIRIVLNWFEELKRLAPVR